MDDLQTLWDDPAIPVVLRSTDTSPFGRKVRMALIRLGLEARITREPADTLDAEDSLRRQNPLGKMPCLLIGNDAFFDSHVILEMLDALAGGGVLAPKDGLARYRILTRAKLADGITDAALLVTYEGRFRESGNVSERWLSHQKGKIVRGLDAFEAYPPDPLQADLVTITLAAALGYLDWRQPLEWRDDHPALAGWLDEFARTHAFWGATERIKA